MRKRIRRKFEKHEEGRKKGGGGEEKRKRGGKDGKKGRERDFRVSKYSETNSCVLRRCVPPNKMCIPQHNVRAMSTAGHRAV